MLLQTTDRQSKDQVFESSIELDNVLIEIASFLQRESRWAA